MASVRPFRVSWGGSWCGARRPCSYAPSRRSRRCGTVRIGDATFVVRRVTDAALTNQHAGCRRAHAVQHGVRMWRIGGHRAAVASCAVHMCALSLHQLRGLGEATFVGRWVTDAALTNQHAGCRRARAFQHGVRMWRIGGHRTAVRQLGRTHTHALITPVAGRAVAVDGAGQRDGWGNQSCESGADERPRQPG